MTADHPDLGLLERFMRNETEGEESRRVVRHLLSGCARCVAVTRRFWSLGEGGQLELPGDPHPASYGGIFERLAEEGFRRERDIRRDIRSNIRSDIRADRRDAPARLAELLGLPPSAGRARVETDRRFQTPAVCELLIGESRRAGEPALAAVFAEWAVAAAELLDARRYGAALVRSLRGRAWAWLGNARRLAGDLRRAEEALSRAEEPLLEGADPLDGAELEELKARLLAAQGKPEEAERRLDRTLGLYRTLGERRLEARVLIQKGTIRGWSQDPEAPAQAIRFLREGLSLMEKAEDPALMAFGLHRLALLLAEVSGAGHSEALRAIRQARALYREQGDGPNLVRLRHLEGRIADARGDAETAEAAFLEARERYVAEGLGGEAAEVLFDLAIFYTRRGRSPEIHRLVENLLPILQTRDIRQGVAAALLYIRRLVETGHATLDVLDELARYVASLPRDRRPALR
jgi:tetratricopeptide (TPR) repeat protein